MDKKRIYISDIHMNTEGAGKGCTERILHALGGFCIRKTNYVRMSDSSLDAA